MTMVHRTMEEEKMTMKHTDTYTFSALYSNISDTLYFKRKNYFFSFYEFQLTKQYTKIFLIELEYFVKWS